MQALRVLEALPSPGEAVLQRTQPLTLPPAHVQPNAAVPVWAFLASFLIHPSILLTLLYQNGQPALKLHLCAHLSQQGSRLRLL